MQRTTMTVIELSRAFDQLLPYTTPVHCVCGEVLGWVYGEFFLGRIKGTQRDHYYPSRGLLSVECCCGLFMHADTAEGWYSPGDPHDKHDPYKGQYKTKPIPLHRK